uniref:Uncharacterized protein n=1 Tax=Anguilla anguilla TaxID=7936 RepID=A0A0E9UE39_ANGAN
MLQITGCRFQQRPLFYRQPKTRHSIETLVL